MPSVAKLSLYDTDLTLWFADTLAKLRGGNFSEVDVMHLIEEIEGLAGRERNEIESRLDVLLSHLLKRLYVDSPYDYRGWENTIREQRKQLRRMFKPSPSLRQYAQEVFPEAWQDALADVEANYPDTMFPHEWPYSRTVESLLSASFWTS
ncbi:MAG: DUF29 domain-containing protein [Leptolyngbyaceae cyanobacterium SM2_5_2]|nr:DUF29 domain-containing protein [Leptolyngbyaceae cyanobacterium SM2_5_2]